MSCYDSVTFCCPNCGTECVVQSKTGECLLGFYPHTAVPLEIATGANRYAPFKCVCGNKWEFELAKPGTVCLRLRKVN